MTVDNLVGISTAYTTCLFHSYQAASPSGWYMVMALLKIENNCVGDKRLSNKVFLGSILHCRYSCMCHQISWIWHDILKWIIWRHAGPILLSSSLVPCSTLSWASYVLKLPLSNCNFFINGDLALIWEGKIWISINCKCFGIDMFH